MPGTIIITGATSPLAKHIIQLLASRCRAYTLILTSRDPQKISIPTGTPTSTDRIITKNLGLNSLSSVHDFATTIATDIQIGLLPPLSSIICTASHWNLRKPKPKKRNKNKDEENEIESEITDDGYERTFQVNHIAHATLVLRLLAHFSREEGGKIVLLDDGGCEHWRMLGISRRDMDIYPRALPDDLDFLVKQETESQVTKNHITRGLQRYATSKLAMVTWMHALNRHLEEDIALNSISAVAVNPGTLTDSDFLRANTPFSLKFKSLFITRPFLYFLRHLTCADSTRTATMRTCAEAAVDIVQLATNTTPGQSGCVTLGDTLGRTDLSSSPMAASFSLDEDEDEMRQEALWAKTLEWAKISDANTALKVEY
ncbi:hypothetical protein BDW62DRAFT_204745 [Aspergillus aurantiobrunneus]